MIYIKVHEASNASMRVIAVCDAELVGKKFEEGNMNIDINERFFKGKIFNKESAKKFLRNALEDYCTFNIVGKKAIEIALDIGLIKKENVKHINEIPMALIFV